LLKRMFFGRRVMATEPAPALNKPLSEVQR
jgi:hypothetical protein